MNRSSSPSDDSRLEDHVRIGVLFVELDRLKLAIEGPMDALAIVAGGAANVVAIGSRSYAWPEHFRGVKGAGAFRDALALEGVAATLLDARVLGEHKDAAAYWQARGALPPELLDALASPSPATSYRFEPNKAIRSARVDGDAFAQLQRLARDCPLTAADLTVPERAEARRLAADPDYPASALAADLARQWDSLDVRDRTAGLYALALATTPGRSFAA